MQFPGLPPFIPLASALAALPAQAGSYLLRLHLETPQQLAVGHLGAFDLPAGEYVYCGSAFGPGGIRARVLRHTRPGDKIHWHIDALRRVAVLQAIAWQVDARAECAWSQWLASQPGAHIPIPGFGASDCRAACAAHLIKTNQQPENIRLAD